MKASLLLILILFATPSYSKQWSRQELIDYTNLSPLYVDQHNKEGWTGLFTQNSFIQDPVGGHTFTPKQIGMFWDAFISKNNIKFIIHRDIVSGMSVVRDAVVDAYLPSVDAHVLTPAHLRYDLMEVNDELRVKSLRAYWNMPAVTKDTLSRGALGRQIMTVQLKATMDALGYKLGLSHFMKASFAGVGKRGQHKVNKMIHSLNMGNKKQFLKQFHKNGKFVFNSDNTSADLLNFLNGKYKILNIKKMISSGNSVGFNADLVLENSAIKPALFIANFKNLKISNVEVFIESHQ